MRAQVADREAELGRPLNRDEQRGVIAQFGHPVAMAARYWPPSYLIGPVMYPYYWPVLRIAIGLALAVHFVSAILLLMAGAAWSDAGRAALSAWNSALAVFAWTTLAFWMVDRQVARVGSGDKSMQAAVTGPLGKHVHQAATDVAGRAMRDAGCVMRDVDHIVRGVERSVGGLASISPMAHLLVHGVITMWWLAALKIPSLMFGQAASVTEFAPVWDRLSVPIAVLALAMFATRFWTLNRPELARTLDRATLILRAAALVVVYFVLRAGEWLVLRGSSDEQARFNVPITIDERAIPLIEFLNYSIASVLVAVAVVFVIGIVRDLRRLLVQPSTQAARSY